MPRELTPEELELVEERLADWFANECDGIAIELQFDRPFTKLEEAAINAVFEARFREDCISLVLASRTGA